ncbi:cytochrome P450 [Amylostereum chailletii]|nr:cytochrome P450 [Amylostereum chailletii]
MYAFTQNPPNFARFREEILTVVGPTRAPTPDDIRTCKFVRVVLNEMMPLNFSPDRWLDDRLKIPTVDQFIFLPLNAGPRICLGEQFAYNEFSFFLIRLLQSFSSLSLALDAQPASSLPPQASGEDREKLWLKSHLTSYWKGGVWVRMDAAGCN